MHNNQEEIIISDKNPYNYINNEKDLSKSNLQSVSSERNDQQYDYEEKDIRIPEFDELEKDNKDEKENKEPAKQDKPLAKSISTFRQTLRAEQDQFNNVLPSKLKHPPFDFTDKKTRMNFIKKVYAILSTQLLITFLVVLAVFLLPSLQAFQVENMWLVIVCAVISIISLYALGCFRKLARNVPWNYILLFVFTITESYIVSYIASKYSTSTVLIAAGLTTAMVVGLTLYAIYTKKDFTIMGGLLTVCLIVFIIASLIGAVVRNEILNLILAAIGVILFGVFLVFDTQMIIGKNKRGYTIDDYILGAVNLYIDIVQIFLFMLQIVGSANDD